MNKTGIELIAEERQRQVAIEGHSRISDIEENDSGELAAAASCYALNAACQLNPRDQLPLPTKPYAWPWSGLSWKPKNPLRDLVRAGALIAAEIDRLLITDAAHRDTIREAVKRGDHDAAADMPIAPPAGEK